MGKKEGAGKSLVDKVVEVIKVQNSPGGSSRQALLKVGPNSIVLICVCLFICVCTCLAQGDEGAVPRGGGVPVEGHPQKGCDSKGFGAERTEVAFNNIF